MNTEALPDDGPDITSPATAEELKLLSAFSLLARAVCRAGLTFARRDNPHCYEDMKDVIERGLAVPELVVEYPRVEVILRLRQIDNGQRGDVVAELFRWQPRTVPHDVH